MSQFIQTASPYARLAAEQAAKSRANLRPSVKKTAKPDPREAAATNAVVTEADVILMVLLGSRELTDAQIRELVFSASILAKSI